MIWTVHCAWSCYIIQSLLPVATLSADHAFCKLLTMVWISFPNAIRVKIWFLWNSCSQIVKQDYPGSVEVACIGEGGRKQVSYVPDSAVCEPQDVPNKVALTAFNLSSCIWHMWLGLSLDLQVSVAFGQCHAEQYHTAELSGRVSREENRNGCHYPCRQWHSASVCHGHSTSHATCSPEHIWTTLQTDGTPFFLSLLVLDQWDVFCSADIYWCKKNMLPHWSDGRVWSWLSCYCRV